ncbi:hypothetical protein A4A49_53937, partial [Nicotiana attenuata]
NTDDYSVTGTYQLVKDSSSDSILHFQFSNSDNSRDCRCMSSAYEFFFRFCKDSNVIFVTVVSISLSQAR